MNYLIKFRTKRDLRLLLRHNCRQKIAKSSLYKIAGFYYILLQTNTQPQFPANIKTQTIYQDTLKVANQFTNDINLQLKNPAEEYLLNWAKSEILQTIDYIRFEQNSVLSNNSRVADCFGIFVYRCFESLVDIFAILNYTADSFSDGGRFNQIDSALIQIEQLCSAGAAVIDLGVQSTRPGALTLKPNDEIKLLKQILPHVIPLKSKLNFELSIDTYHHETALWLNDFAIDIINDVSGNLSSELVTPILNSGRRYVAMHSLCIPANPEFVLSIDINPIDYIYTWLNKKVDAIVRAGCDISNLILDPGIGFGLTIAGSWFVTRHMSKLGELPCEVLFGHSRKLFFSHITSKLAANRDLETAIVAAKIVPYVDYLRLHELELFNQINTVFNQMSVTP